MLSIEKVRPDYTDGIINGPIIGDIAKTKMLRYKNEQNGGAIFFPLYEMHRIEEAKEKENCGKFWNDFFYYCKHAWVAKKKKDPPFL